MMMTATVPKAAPPAALPAEALKTPLLQLKLVDDKVGFSVFASRGFCKGRTIYRERIVLEATHHVHRKGIRNAYERYCSLSSSRRNAMHGAFPTLAAVNGVKPDDATGSLHLIGSMIMGGATIDICLTADEHKKMRRSRRTGLWWIRRPNARNGTLKWFARYAFRLEAASTLTHEHNQAGVYLLSSLLNHRCPGYFNCRVITDVDEIRLVAERDINAGEELCINYGVNHRYFTCRGPCCRRQKRSSNPTT